jgi:hypothetical protein
LSGLNNSAIAFKRVSTQEALGQADWLAIFPKWFDRSLWKDIITAFEPCAEIRMPVEKYTVCKCPENTVMMVLKRRTPTDE